MEDIQLTKDEEDEFESLSNLDVSSDVGNTGVLSTASKIAEEDSSDKKQAQKSTKDTENIKTKASAEKDLDSDYRSSGSILTAAEKGMEKAKAIEKKYVQEINDFYKPFIVQPPMPDENRSKIFLNPNEYYKTLLSLEKNSAKQLNKNINMFLSEKDIKTQQVARNRTITSFWNFYEQMLGDHKNSKLTEEAKYLLRYSLLVSSIVPKQVLNVIGNIDINAIPSDKNTVYYVDEWLQLVSSGKVSQSIVNEAELSDEARENMLKQRLLRMKKQKDIQIQTAQKINDEIKKTQNTIKRRDEEIETIRTETSFGFLGPYTSRDLEKFKMIHELIHLISQKNKQLEVQYNSIVNNDKNIEKLTIELSQIEINKKESPADSIKSMKSRVVIAELQAVRQMHKLCIGRRGNHFPILYSHYFSSSLQQMGYRERVLQVLKQVELIDYTVFQRIIKGNTARFFPLVILVPCYGHRGFCWEPYERYQRNTSSAKIVIPMYPRDLYVAIVHAIGDYRWQLSKEMAGQLWMEEGLSGWYFQWFDANIKKGDVKEKFIEDYSLWMRWEQIGIQKLDKAVREIFWRFIPFNRKIKDKLVTMSPVYIELYKKERNRHITEML